MPFGFHLEYSFSFPGIPTQSLGMMHSLAAKLEEGTKAVAKGRRRTNGVSLRLCKFVDDSQQL